MNSRVSLIIFVCLCLTGLTAGCAGAARQSNAPAKIEPLASVPPSNQTNVVHLSSGDRVLVSVEAEPSEFFPVVVERQVSTDGTLSLWGTQRAAVAGLTLDEAACTIRFALITNYYGFIFRNVKVQRSGCSDPRDCGQCENLMSPARGR